MTKDADTNEGIKNDSSSVRYRQDFFARYGTFFRRSSLLLIIALGRDYGEKVHVRDLARSVGYDVSLVSKNLKELEAMGLVRRENIGNLVFYQAEADSVLLRQLKIFITLLELNDLVQAVSTRSSLVILYGSCARGEDTHDSDIDLFIETLDKERVKSGIDTFRKKLGRTVSPVIVTPDETYQIRQNDKNFYSSITNGITLTGGRNVF